MNILDGIRVLDFGRYIAGPYCAALLGDLGAEVIRVERIDGSEDRYIHPIGNPNGEGAMFMQMNRNKKGLTLNPTREGSQKIVKKLIEYKVPKREIAKIISSITQEKVNKIYDSIKNL